MMLRLFSISVFVSYLLFGTLISFNIKVYMWVGNQTSGTEVQFGLKTIQVSNFFITKF